MKQLIDYITEVTKIAQGEYRLPKGDSNLIITIQSSKVYINYTERYGNREYRFILSKQDFMNLVDAVKNHKQYSVWLDPASVDRKNYDHMTLRYEPTSDHIVLNKHPREKGYPNRELDWYGNMMEPIIKQLG